MKVIKNAAWGILLLLLLVVVVSFFIPSKTRVERVLIIKAKPERVFELINNFKQWNRWSPWHKRDSQMNIVYGTVYEGEGASYSWKSEYPKVGEGRMMIIKSDAPVYVNIQMHFGNMGISKTAFLIQPIAEGVTVKWSMENDGEGVSWLMYIPLKYFSFFMDDIVGADFEQGLTNIKQIAEASPIVANINGFDVEERTIPAMEVISIREKINNKDIGTMLGRSFSAMGQYMNKSGITLTGNPFTIWHTYNEDEVDMEAVIPINRKALSKGEILYSELPATKAIVIKYYGNYQKMTPIYEAAINYIKRRGLQSADSPREIYRTNPGMEMDTAKWLTELVFPIR